MQNYWLEFLTVALVHLLAVASPGPDFAVMLRQALTQARRNALLTAMGIGIGILLHVGYSLLGIGLIIQQSVMLFTVLKVIGAVYLLYIAWHCLRAKPGAIRASERRAGPDWLGGVPARFLTNALNPKPLFSCPCSPSSSIQARRFCCRPDTASIWHWPRACGLPWWRCSLPTPVSAGVSTGSDTGLIGPWGASWCCWPGSCCCLQ